MSTGFGPLGEELGSALFLRRRSVTRASLLHHWLKPAIELGCLHCINGGGGGVGQTHKCLCGPDSRRIGDLLRKKGQQNYSLGSEIPALLALARFE